MSRTPVSAILDCGCSRVRHACRGCGEGSRQQIDGLVNHLVARESIRPSQIMILSPHSFVRSALAGRAKAGKYRLA